MRRTVMVVSVDAARQFLASMVHSDVALFVTWNCSRDSAEPRSHRQ